MVIVKTSICLKHFILRHLEIKLNPDLPGKIMAGCFVAFLGDIFYLHKKSRAVDRSTIQFWAIGSQYT